MSTRELAWLKKTATSMKSVIEIGSWKGRSTFALCSSGCPLVIAVDHFKGSTEHQFDQMPGIDLRAEFDKNVGHFPNLRVLAMSSEDASGSVGLVDMVFIDASHEYESVNQDITLWAPKARVIVAGHDYTIYGSVKRAVDEYFGRPPDEQVESIWSMRL